MKTIKWLAISALFMGLFFSACKKNEDNDLSVETTQQIVVSSEDQTTAEDLFEDVDYQVDEAIETRGGGGNCPTVTADPDFQTYPRTVTIDFGDGCEGPNGRIRKGKIVVEVTGEIITAGTSRTATFVDFFIDDAQIEGTRTILNEGFDDDGNVTFSRTVTGGKVTFPNGDVATWEADHLLTQTEGGNTITFFDNVFEITGSSNGVNRNGNAYTLEITDPLVKKSLCPWIVSGQAELNVMNKSVMINYGNGICDRKAILTLPNGTEVEILIKKWW